MSKSIVSPSRKFVFYLIMFTFIYLLAEGAAYMGYGILYSESFSNSELEKRRDRIVNQRREEIRSQEDASKHRDAGYQQEIIHPYLGFVMDYRDLSCPGYGFCDDNMRGYENAPVTTKAGNDYMVAIMGGSVAAQTSLKSSRGYLVERLKTLPGLQDKNILLQTIAIGGYKQPQQLMALNWFYSIGADFDLVINIDGFNEVALPPVENLPQGTYPFFPRVWHHRASVAEETSLLARIGRIAFLKDRRARLANKQNGSKLSFSPISNLVWRSRDERLRNDISDLELSLQNYRLKDHHIRPLMVTGPDYEYTQPDELYADLADNWYRSSLQMNAIATQYGARYYHFLQPNQYLEGAKPMRDEELVVAYLEDHPYRAGVVEGYPHLIRRGVELVSNGVAFFDLTRIFERDEQVLYSDDCCHLNEKGYNLMIDHMVEKMRSRFKQPGAGE